VTEAGTWFRFVIAALAVWRVTHLLAAEDGPWDLILRCRRALGDTIWGRMLDCFNCLSLWIAVPFTFFVVSGAADRFVAWLAMSGAACLANRVADRVGGEPVVFETLDRQEDRGSAE
jgi:hypothetical protein